MMFYGKCLVFVTLSMGLSGAEESACIFELHVPQYPILARQARLSGIVSVGLKVDGQGVPKSISLDGGHKLLQNISRRAVAGSSFEGKCAGSVINLKFKFELEAPSAHNSGSVIFRPPNLFIIRASYFPVTDD